MKVELSILENDCLTKIVDKNSYGDNILKCLGHSTLTVGEEIIHDDLEVIIRAAEIISFSDGVEGNLFPSTSLSGFNYKFEQPFFLIGCNNGVNILSRWDTNKTIEHVSVLQAKILRESVFEFVETVIMPLSPFVASALCKREVL